MILGATALVTINVAELLIALPAELLTTHLNVAPLSAMVVGGVVQDALVAPAMFTLFFCHWYDRGDAPVAVTANVAVCPSFTVWLVG